MTNDEAPMSKEIRSPNDEFTVAFKFVISHSFVIRA
jgi:hypothetical protein